MSSRRSDRRTVPPLISDPFAPSSDAPIRCVFRPHSANTEVQLHQHPWAQMVFSSQGVVRVHTGRSAFTVPPWRAVWIPPETMHTASVLEGAQLHSLYLLADADAYDLEGRIKTWCDCRVIEVRPLLRELVIALAEDDLLGLPTERYGSLVELIFSEIFTAPVLALGIALPSERRVLALCEDFLRDPRLDRSLSDLCLSAGASVSTMNRLFRAEVGCSFVDWRKQALLSQALTLAAKGYSVSQIAFELGYSSLSSFSFMVTQLVGMPPSKALKIGC